MICTHPKCEAPATRVVRFWLADIRGALHTRRCSSHVAIGGVRSQVEYDLPARNTWTAARGYTCPVCECQTGVEGCERCDQ